MRAARLLEMLLLLQNRGRLTSAELARELEVSPRTILRDVDAMTEAGLPVIVHQGNQGGIELGFDYRSRLAAFEGEEAEAMGLILSAPVPELEALGLSRAGRRARAKLFEAFSEPARRRMRAAQRAFPFEAPAADDDPRLPALAQAVRENRRVRINVGRAQAAFIHPVALISRGGDWLVRDALAGRDIPVDDCGSVNISAKTFQPKSSEESS